MPDYRLKYCDLHFHTDYSDNRDRATLSQMMERGRALGLTCFGSGDHNHNQTIGKWKEQTTETTDLLETNPDLTLLNNCEGTFRLGHFLVLGPAEVRGSVDESYGWLLGQEEAFVILNHPYLPSDRWKEVFLPHARGVEVINGSVLTKAIQMEGNLFQRYHLVDYPHIACYGDYLHRGVKVLPFGASDAHTLNEIGLGVTGIWSEGSRTFIEDLDGQEIFAATDTGLALEWLRPETEGETGFFRGRITVGKSPFTGRQPGMDSSQCRIECYRGRSMVRELIREISGIRTQNDSVTIEFECPVEDEGYYWFGFSSGHRFAVSGPRWLGGEPPGPISREIEGLDDEIWLYNHREIPVAFPQQKTPLPESWVIFAGDEGHECRDVDGHLIPLEMERLDQDIIISRTGEASIFNEFFDWLDRNEIHEYRFCTIEYSIENGLLEFRGRLLPHLQSAHLPMDGQSAVIGREIRSRMDQFTTANIDLRVAARYRCRLKGGTRPLNLPLRLQDNELGCRCEIALNSRGRVIQYFRGK